jgi:hypothetical protein
MSRTVTFTDREAALIEEMCESWVPANKHKTPTGTTKLQDKISDQIQVKLREARQVAILQMTPVGTPVKPIPGILRHHGSH